MRYTFPTLMALAHAEAMREHRRVTWLYYIDGVLCGSEYPEQSK